MNKYSKALPKSTKPALEPMIEAVRTPVATLPTAQVSDTIRGISPLAIRNSDALVEVDKFVIGVREAMGGTPMCEKAYNYLVDALNEALAIQKQYAIDVMLAEVNDRLQ